MEDLRSQDIRLANRVDEEYAAAVPLLAEVDCSSLSIVGAVLAVEGILEGPRFKVVVLRRLCGTYECGVEDLAFAIVAGKTEVGIENIRARYREARRIERDTDLKFQELTGPAPAECLFHD